MPPRSCSSRRSSSLCAPARQCCVCRVERVAPHVVSCGACRVLSCLRLERTGDRRTARSGCACGTPTLAGPLSRRRRDTCPTGGPRGLSGAETAACDTIRHIRSRVSGSPRDAWRAGRVHRLAPDSRAARSRRLRLLRNLHAINQERRCRLPRIVGTADPPRRPSGRADGLNTATRHSESADASSPRRDTLGAARPTEARFPCRFDHSSKRNSGSRPSCTAQDHHQRSRHPRSARRGPMLC